MALGINAIGNLLGTVNANNALIVTLDGGSAVATTFVGPAADNTAAPPFTFTGDLDTGYASSAANTLALVAGGTTRLSVSSSAVTSTVPIVIPSGSAGAGNPAIYFSAETTLGWYRSSAGNITQPGSYTTTVDVTAGRNMQLAADAGLYLMGAANDVILGRKAAANLQLGVDAAGVTDQTISSPTRITSDGVGANFTFDAGPGRGAAGGSLIFRTAPAAGAGVTGTLTTALTIDSGQNATVVGNVTIGNAKALLFGTHGHIWDPNANGKFNFSTAAETAGISTDVVTNGLLKLFAIDGTTNASIALGANLAIAGTAPTAAGTGMAFTVGTGSTSFDWSITITTANAQTAFTLTLPTATNAWTCQAQNFTTPAGQILQVTARSTTTITLTQYNTTTGIAAAFADNNVIIGTCTAH